jgi:MFS family permease
MELQQSHIRARKASIPRLSRHAGFWAITSSFLVLAAFSTAPSSLYGLYARHDHLASLTITLVYAVYAVGIVASLVLVGHVSDWYGRRTVLIPGLGLATLAALVFLVWNSLPGLLLGRVLTGVSLGATVATASAFISDLDAREGVVTRRSQVATTVANIGGFAVGPLVAGLLVRYAPDPLTLTFVVFLALLILATFVAYLAPEGHDPERPLPSYHPQRLKIPASPVARNRFLASTVGVFVAFAVVGLFAGLAGTFLAGSLHDSSSALTGLVIFLVFGAGAVVQVAAGNWPPHRLIRFGLLPLTVGLALLVTFAWTSPSLALFLAGGIVLGAGSGAIFRGSLATAVSTSNPDDRASVLATFFTAGYVGVSLPVLAVGVALQYLTPRVTLLTFGVAVGLGILAAAPVLVRRPQER